MSFSRSLPRRLLPSYGVMVCALAAPWSKRSENEQRLRWGKFRIVRLFNISGDFPTMRLVYLLVLIELSIGTLEYALRNGRMDDSGAILGRSFFTDALGYRGNLPLNVINIKDMYSFMKFNRDLDNTVLDIGYWRIAFVTVSAD